MPRGGIALACVVVLTLGTLAGRPEASGRAGAREARPMPQTLSGLQARDMDGRRWTADDLRGRVTLIDVWATWCAPCLTELPFLKRARARYSREDFEILGVSFDVSDRRTFVSWINRHRVDWPQVHDGRGRQGPAARQLQVRGVPTSFLLDREGRLVAMNLRGERLLAAVDALVREKTASVTSIEGVGK
jgi:thiol-disulfide isomerase/thioredoxin